eukprot:g20557.t1
MWLGFTIALLCFCTAAVFRFAKSCKNNLHLMKLVFAHRLHRTERSTNEISSWGTMMAFPTCLGRGSRLISTRLTPVTAAPSLFGTQSRRWLATGEQSVTIIDNRDGKKITIPITNDTPLDGKKITILINNGTPLDGKKIRISVTNGTPVKSQLLAVCVFCVAAETARRSPSPSPTARRCGKKITITNGTPVKSQLLAVDGKKITSPSPTTRLDGKKITIPITNGTPLDGKKITIPMTAACCVCVCCVVCKKITISIPNGTPLNGKKITIPITNGTPVKSQLLAVDGKKITIPITKGTPLSMHHCLLCVRRCRDGKKINIPNDTPVNAQLLAVNGKMITVPITNGTPVKSQLLAVDGKKITFPITNGTPLDGKMITIPITNGTPVKSQLLALCLSVLCGLQRRQEDHDPHHHRHAAVNAQLLAVDGKKITVPITNGTPLDGKKITIPITNGTLDAQKFKPTGLRLYDPGLMNTAAGTSKITFIDGDKGILRYRGYDIAELAEKSNFLEVAYLLIYGDLPSKEQFNDLPSKEQFKYWSGRVMKHNYVHEKLKTVMSSMQYDAHPMGMLISTMAAMSTFQAESNPALRGSDIYKDQTVRNKQMCRIIGRIPTVAAMCYRNRIGRPFVDPAMEGVGYVENFLYMMDKLSHENYHPNPVLVKALEALFILHADHEFNCSTTTMRTIASSGVDVYSAVAGACAALYGPAHGGANEAVLRMLDKIGHKDNIKGFMEQVKSKKTRLMGFGHRVYRNYDPRAKLVRQIAHQVFDVVGADPLIDLATELEHIALNDDFFVSRKLYPNVDFYSGVIYKAMGFPTDFFTVLFAIPRVVGWLAHWNELMDDPENRIVRPQQVYLGPSLRSYEPIFERSDEVDHNIKMSMSTMARRRDCGTWERHPLPI